jgi:hypothetical protein
MQGQNCFTPNQLERMLRLDMSEVDPFLRNQGFRAGSLFPQHFIAFGDTVPVQTRIYRTYSQEVHIHIPIIDPKQRFLQLIISTDCYNQLGQELAIENYTGAVEKEVLTFTKPKIASVHFEKNGELSIYPDRFASAVLVPLRESRKRERAQKIAAEKKWVELQSQFESELAANHWESAYFVLEQICREFPEKDKCESTVDRWKIESGKRAKEELLQGIRANQLSEVDRALKAWLPFQKNTSWIAEVTAALKSAQEYQKKTDLQSQFQSLRVQKNFSGADAVLLQLQSLNLTKDEKNWLQNQRASLEAERKILNRRKTEILNYAEAEPEAWADFERHAKETLTGLIQNQNNGSIQWNFTISTDTNGHVIASGRALQGSLPEVLLAHWKGLPASKLQGYDFASRGELNYRVAWKSHKVTARAKQGNIKVIGSSVGDTRIKNYLNQRGWPYGTFVFSEKTIEWNGQTQLELVFKKHRPGMGGYSALLYSLVLPGRGLRRAQYGAPHPRWIKPYFWAGAAGATEGYARYLYSRYRTNPTQTSYRDDANLYHQISLGAAAYFVYDYVREHVSVVRTVQKNVRKSRELNKSNTSLIP